MRAGRRDRLIQIQRLVLTKDEVGADVESWVKVPPDIWAEYLPGPGREVIAAQQKVGESVDRFNIVYRPGITVRHRLAMDGVNYEITACHEIGRRRGIELVCKLIDEN
jgi:SPP1 family predicted phage head-tail adaptor